MADTIVSTGSDDNYGFNLEWIAEGSGIGEEICGVDKDCIVVPSSPIIPKIENCDSDYVEIQVTEEEVIAGQWDDNADGVGELEVSGLTQDVLVPLDEEQNEYFRLHPYPCDFCSRRFSKPSTLTVHMLTHQTQRLHDCNMCGATYKRKLELVEHMKIHSYPPIKTENEEFDDFCMLENKKSPRVRKKKKKNDISFRPTHAIDDEMDFINHFTAGIKQEFDAHEDHYDDQHHRFPIIDPARPYVCQFCGIGFAREKALISHKLLHAGDSAVECERCNEVFQSESILEQHMVSRHGKISSKKNNSHYNSRKAIKEETVGQAFMCQMCHLVFSSVDELVRHKENHDLSNGVHSCIICHKEFVVLEDLRNHIKAAHAPTNACSHCAQVFKDRFALTNHLLSHSSPSKSSLTCSVCSRKFPNKVSLKRHAATHELKDKSTTSILCTECGARDFADGRSLLYHRQTEHGVNMSRLFPCVECGKTFNSRSSQQIHIRIHTGERPYGCRYCWKAFGDGGTLRKHERIHTGEKPYVCPVCSKAFNQRVVLREHVRAHHSGTEGKVSDNCYECQVCGNVFGTPEELCADLVHHSDENTAKHRMPTVRKSNLTRKKKSASSFLETRAISPPPKVDYLPAPTKKKSAKNSSPDNLDEIVKLGKSTLENLNSISGGKRARIVRSGKKGFHKGQNKRYLNKKEKGKNSKLLSNGSYASKYAVSHSGMGGVSHDIKCETLDDDDDRNYSGEIMDLMNGDGETSTRSRPRTKNVSYHNMRVDHKTYDLAMFPEVEIPSMELPTEPEFDLPSPKKKKSCKKRKKYSKVKEVDMSKITGRGECQYINGITIDPSPVPEQEEQIETSIVSDDLEIKQDGSISCQICSEVFLTTDMLFRHIHTHF